MLEVFGKVGCVFQFKIKFAAVGKGVGRLNSALAYVKFRRQSACVLHWSRYWSGFWVYENSSDRV